MPPRAYTGRFTPAHNREKASHPSGAAPGCEEVGATGDSTAKSAPNRSA